MTPTITALIWKATEAGVALEVTGDGRLKVTWPAGAGNPALREDLRAARDEIVDALSALDADGVAGPALTLVHETQRHGVTVRTYRDTAGDEWTHISWETGSEWRRAAALDLGPKEKVA